MAEKVNNSNIRIIFDFLRYYFMFKGGGGVAYCIAS